MENEQLSSCIFKIKLINGEQREMAANPNTERVIDLKLKVRHLTSDLFSRDEGQDKSG